MVVFISRAFRAVFCSVTGSEVELENKYMRLALNEAERAAENGDVPVGAVIVKDGEVVARAHNTREKDLNALGHAELSTIDKACRALGRWRLDDCDLYVTLEPCLMCTGACIQARLRRVYFGAYDPQKGYGASNHIEGRSFECYCGIMEQECTELLNKFFNNLRK